MKTRRNHNKTMKRRKTMNKKGAGKWYSYFMGKNVNSEHDYADEDAEIIKNRLKSLLEERFKTKPDKTRCKTGFKRIFEKVKYCSQLDDDINKIFFKIAIKPFIEYIKKYDSNPSIMQNIDSQLNVIKFNNEHKNLIFNNIKNNTTSYDSHIKFFNFFIKPTPFSYSKFSLFWSLLIKIINSSLKGEQEQEEELTKIINMFKIFRDIIVDLYIKHGIDSKHIKIQHNRILRHYDGEVDTVSIMNYKVTIYDKDVKNYMWCILYDNWITKNKHNINVPDTDAADNGILPMAPDEEYRTQRFASFSRNSPNSNSPH